MITIKRSQGSSPSPRRATVLPAARDLIKAGLEAEQARLSSLGDTDPDTQKRRELGEGLARDAAVVELMAAGDRLLDDMEVDPAQDPSTFRRDAERAFAAQSDERLAPFRGVRNRVALERAMTPVLADFSATADMMQRELEDVATAQVVFMAAQSAIEAAQANPDGKGPLFDRVHDLTRKAPLSAERQDEVAAAVTARAMTLGLDDLLGERFDAHRPRARQITADNQRVEREAGEPSVILAAAEAPTDRRGLSSKQMNGQPLVQTTQAASDTLPVTIPDTRSGDRRSQDLIRIGRLLLAGSPAGLLAAALLSATSTPAGPQTQELRETLDDRRDVRFRFNPMERTGTLTVTSPDGDAVRFILQQTEGAGLVFTDGIILLNDLPGRTLTRDELTSVIDAVVSEFAKAGVRIDIGGDGDETDTGSGQGTENEADASSPEVDRAGSQGTASPDPDDENNEDESSEDDDPTDPDADGFGDWLNNQQYENAPYHPESVPAGRKSPSPANGGDALRFSTKYSANSPHRVAVDSEAQEFVVFMRTERGLWHGHVRQWSELRQSQQAVLRKLRYVNKKGRIILNVTE